MHSFPYDRFQEEAVACIRQGISVFVSAPTGAGKTVIAEVAIEEALKSGGMAPPPDFIQPPFRRLDRPAKVDPPKTDQSGGGVAIYTAPIKALSNQKFRDFHAVYGNRVGILTGDVTLNPDAPLLIMTTEIYRNSLFQEQQRFARCRWIVFDEIHFLDDPERGTVWEEALLLTPRETEILALSATIPNAHQLASWIERIHGRPVKVVQETHRPVPLVFGFQCQDELHWNLGSLKTQGYQGMDRPRIHQRPFRMRRSRRGKFYFKNPARAPAVPDQAYAGKPNRVDHLLKEIQTAEHLPCLYFTFSRRRAQELAWESAALNFLPPESRPSLLKQFDELCARYQISHEHSAAEMRELVGLGIAYHHAGLLPTVKEVVEILFSRRLLPVIFTTETFALGVNMPARSVVLDTLVKGIRRPGRDSQIRTLLRVRDLFQMAGRAGRRGMDEKGFVYLRVNPREVPFHDLEHLLEGKPEQVSSRFNLTYATLLNLHRNSAGADLLPFYRKTLHAFQATPSQQKEILDLIQRKLGLLKQLRYLHPNGLTPKGHFATELYGYELILSELFETGFLDHLDLTDLGILLLALAYEPRRGGLPVKLPHRIRGLASEAGEILEEIHRQERRFRVSPLSKPPAFHLAAAMERWIGGAAFDKIVSLSQTDEGELIRYFRMTLQLARELASAPTASRHLKTQAAHLIQRINRDPVDAEAELRRSL